MASKRLTKDLFASFSLRIAASELSLDRSLYRLSPRIDAYSGDVRRTYSHCSLIRSLSCLRRLSRLEAESWLSRINRIVTYARMREVYVEEGRTPSSAQRGVEPRLRAA